MQKIRSRRFESLQLQTGIKSKSPSESSHLYLFQDQFDQLLNLASRKFDWLRFNIAFANCYCSDTSAAGKDIRLLVSLHDLKYTFSGSNESLLERCGSIYAGPKRCSTRCRYTPHDNKSQQLDRWSEPVSGQSVRRPHAGSGNCNDRTDHPSERHARLCRQGRAGQ